MARRSVLVLVTWYSLMSLGGVLVRGEVKLITPAGYLAGVPFPVRVEVRDSAGNPDRSLWDAEATLSSDQPGVVLSTNRVALRNGLGTVLLTIAGTADFALSATVHGEQAVRRIGNRSGQPVTRVGGILAGVSNTWSGLIELTNSVVIPVGRTLSLQPDTLVLIPGAASGTDGVRIDVQGTLRALGTEALPVAITCATAAANWGQIRHENSIGSIYQYTFISKAGRAPGEGHTGTGPAIRATNSEITFDQSVISDLTAGGGTIGKALMATGSQLTVRGCAFARARMGPEIASTGLVCTDSYFLEMTGPDDADGIYLHNSGARALRISDCVFASGTDDAVDTLDASVTIENCILRDWPNPTEDAKGVSGFNGEVTLRRCLIVNCFVGASTKSNGPLATLRLDHCTISGLEKGVSAATKSNATAGNIQVYLTNSIVLGKDALHSDFGPEKFVSVSYCALGEPWPGLGNLTSDPLFVNAAGGDFSLHPASPCIDAGDPAFPPDANGSRTDIGYYTGQTLTGGFFVHLTSPVTGAVIRGPTNLLLSAAVTSTSGSMGLVEFYQNGVNLGADFDPPYSWVWNGVLQGNYLLSAVAVQAGGLMATSPPVSISVISSDAPETNTLIATGAVWGYLDDGSDPGVAWRELTFEDATWKTDQAQLGYGDGDETTVIQFGPDEDAKYPAAYFRRAFVFGEDPGRVQALNLRLLRDDGAIVYLNGTEAYRISMPPGAVTHSTFATSASDYGWETVSLNPALLMSGTNLVAVEVHQGNGSSSDLSFDLELAAVLLPPPDLSPPYVAAQSPAPGTVSDLSQVSIRFSKPVTGVDASDLLLNGVPAMGVTGSGTEYTFIFPHMPDGLVKVQWSPAHAVTDSLQPGVSFDHTAPNASWEYQLSDLASPRIAIVLPLPDAIVTALSEISLTFNEPVSGVDAADLLINGTPATAVAGSGAGPYVFTFPQLSAPVAKVGWRSSHEVRDTAGNLFQPSGWSYTLESGNRGVVLNEIMYHPASENPREEFVELYNAGPAAVDLTGWRLRGAVEFVFPSVSLAAQSFLVVAADLPTFNGKYPGVGPVIGHWTGTLSNSRERIELDDGRGQTVDSVHYADEGDWAVRQRGVLDRGYRGWVWFAGHDGLGSSLELIQPQLSNACGQNWSASSVAGGTPGAANSTLGETMAPFIEEVAHYPGVPKSSESVVVSARITGGTTPNRSVAVYYRVDASVPGAFLRMPMRDDGQGGDGFGGDKLYSALLPPQTNHAVVEFYIQTVDEGGHGRTWPGPALASVDGAGPVGQVVNALYQVDDTAYPGTQPLYKMIVSQTERAELQAIHDNLAGAANSDAQMNATFLSFDGTGAELRYSIGVRNRGHGTRAAKPNNFRVNFRSDAEWKGVLALNLNAQFTWLQVLGAALNFKSGIVGGYSRAVQLRVNNSDPSLAGPLERTYGSYAANEVIDADWADHHFQDGEGNVYRAIRDLAPPEFDYRTLEVYPALFGPEHKNSYTNTWFKTTNLSEDDWTDLIGMLRVLGPNGTEPFTPENVRRVVNVEQWLRHLAVMSLLGNSETGLNSGFNDDYFMYRGMRDPRFILMYYDLDQILGFNRAFPPEGNLFSATANQGAGRALERLLRHPAFEPLYYETLRELLETSFSSAEFNALVDQTLGSFVPEATRNQIKSWMDARRAFVRTQLPATPGPLTPRLVVSAPPRSPTPRRTAAFTVSGEGITHYRYSVIGGEFSAEMPVSNPIQLASLPDGTNTLRVVGRSASELYLPIEVEKVAQWVINSAWPGVRLNEVLASRTNNGRDQVELFNEGSTSIDLGGMRLTDDRNNPSKFTFSPVILPGGGYLTLDAAQLGFSLSAAGEGVFLFDKASAGGALLDSVEFGPQISDLSIGRIGENGEWQLGPPSLGAANNPQPLGSAAAAKINEWLTAGLSPFPDDFVELFNPESLPVDIGGAYLTDHPAGDPRKSRLPPLSFIPARGFVQFRSGNGEQLDEFGFGLPAEQGEIALLSPEGVRLDSVVYGPQQRGVAMGRCPDGAVEQRALDRPTPGGPNACPTIMAPTQTVVLLPFSHVWKYHASGTDLGPAWREQSYDDSAWLSGPGLIGFEDATLSVPLGTTFPNPGHTTYYFRTSFHLDPALAISAIQVTHLIDDGAAFYLNGQDSGIRLNLEPAATFQTFASSTVGNAAPQVISIPPESLKPGTNSLAVEVHQASADSSDMVFGLQIEIQLVGTNTGQEHLVINEVLANPALSAGASGRAPDWIELYNPANAAVDLAGMSLSDQANLPTRWVFPAGSIVPATGLLTVFLDSNAPVSGTNTGFGLKANGGAVYLFDSAARGGALLDSVSYGLQAAGWSIGRVPDGSASWVLGPPTAAGANQAAMLANPERLRINEWMADPLAGADWFELFNPEPAPVEVSGLWLSDSLSERLKHALAPLSFIGGSSYQRFEADEALADGADHVDFKLSAEGEGIGLSSASGVLIDGVSFGPQLPGISEGRLPDGSSTVVSFPTSPTPGASNQLLLADNDQDGLPNDWETAHGLNPNDARDALADPDGDGAVNLHEHLAGTDPQQPSDYLSLQAEGTTAGVMLRFRTVPGRRYQVEVKDDLETDTWRPLAEVTPQAGQMAEIREPVTNHRRFYRLMVLSE